MSAESRLPAEQAAGGMGERELRRALKRLVDSLGGDEHEILSAVAHARAALAAPPSEPSLRFMLEHTLDLLAAADHSPEAAMWITKYRAVLAGEPLSTELCSCGDCRPHRHEPPAISHHPPSAPPSEPLAGTRGDAAIETLAGEVECAAVSLETAYGGKARAIRQAMEGVRTEWNRLRAASAPPETDGGEEIAHLAALLDDAMRSLRQAETTPINIATTLYRHGVRAARPSPGARP